MDRLCDRGASRTDKHLRATIPCHGCQVSVDRCEGSHTTPHKPMWSPDGKELFYIPRFGRFEAVPVRTRPEFTFGSPTEIVRSFTTGLPNSRALFDVAPDGRFVAVWMPNSLRAYDGSRTSRWCSTGSKNSRREYPCREVADHVSEHVVNDCARPAPGCAAMPEGSWIRSNSCWATPPFRRPRSSLAVTAEPPCVARRCTARVLAEVDPYGRLCGGWRTNRRRLTTTRKRTSECQRR